MYVINGRMDCNCERGREVERESRREREKEGMPCNKHFSSGFCAEKPIECTLI